MNKAFKQDNNWISFFVLRAILLLLGIFLIQINSLEAQKVPGYFISNILDAIRVEFDPPTYPFSDEINFLKLQSKVKYFDSLNKKQTLRPQMAKELSFDYMGEKIRIISVQEKNRGNSAYNTFMRLKIDGKLKLYYIYEQDYSGPGMGGVRILLKYAVQLEDKPLFRLGEFSFRKDLVEYIMPCPDLKKKIEGKIYDREDMDKIVNEFNASCAQ